MAAHPPTPVSGTIGPPPRPALSIGPATTPCGAIAARRWRLFAREPLAPVALLFLALLLLAALLAPVLAPLDPSRVDLAQTALPPSTRHLLGTDTLGRDLLSRALYGARISLAVGLGAAALSAALGLLLGLAAAYRGGILDAAITRLVDAAMAVPAFFLLIALQSIFGSSVLNVILMVSLAGWMAVARVVRALTLSLKEREFVLAARALGCSPPRILLHHLIPNMVGQIGVLFALGVADALLLESALSFIGLGVPSTEPSWGNMLNDAQAAILAGNWWVAVLPGTLILGTALAINLVGDGLQELFSPRVSWQRTLQ